MRSIYCIPKIDQIDKFSAISEKYNAGFEYNDFYIPAVLDQKDLVQELVNKYCSLDRDRSEDTLHGVFLDICVHSADPLIFKVSDFRIHQCMNIASTLGVKAVIFHTNQIPHFKLSSYLDGWVDLNEKYWRGLLIEYPSINIYIENMFDENCELLLRLAKRMTDEPRFGVCLDVAHAHLSDEGLSDWCQKLSPYIRHFHLNDNNGIEDSHNPVGRGSINWSEYKAYTDSLHKDSSPSVLIEVRTAEDFVESVKFMKENKLYPYN